MLDHWCYVLEVVVAFLIFFVSSSFYVIRMIFKTKFNAFGFLKVHKTFTHSLEIRPFSANIYSLKSNNRNTEKSYEIFVLVFLLSTLNRTHDFL